MPRLGSQMLRHRRVRIVRDYGMFDRRDAPKFFSDAKDMKRSTRIRCAAIMKLIEAGSSTELLRFDQIGQNRR